jgi:GT2 family glycosyltransferase
MLLEKGAYNPTVSILICSRDRRCDLEKIVSDLKRMDTHYLFDIVVVEETDDPSPMENVQYVPHPVKNYGFPFARNLSITASTGEILVFVDDDCQIKKSWLDNLLRPFEDKSVVGVQGGVVVPEGTNVVGWAESLLGFPGGGIKRIIVSGGKKQETIEISTLNSAYCRWVVEAVGGFDGRLKLGGEDYLMAKKACRYGKCLFIPEALVTHITRGNLASIWRWFVRRGQAEIGVVRSREYAGSNWRSILRSSLMCKFFAFSMLILLFPVDFIYIISVFFILYFFVQYWRSFSIWRKTTAPFKSYLILPLVKLIMDIAADVGRLKGVIHG